MARYSSFPSFDRLSINELNKELEGLVRAVAENESVFEEDIDQAAKVLLAFKDQMTSESTLSPLLLEKSAYASVAEISITRVIHALKMAIKVLLMLLKQAPSTSFEDTVHQLLSTLSKVYNDLEPDGQENVIATIMDIVICYGYGKKIVGQNTDALPLVINALRSGSMLAKTYALTTIYELSIVDFNKVMLGELGAMEALVNALEENEMEEKGIYNALFRLCEVPCNRSRAAKNGVLRVILNAIKGKKLMDKMLPFLESLLGNLNIHTDMCNLQAVPLLLGIIRESTNPSHQRTSAAILCSICYHNRLLLGEIRKEEEANHTISKLRNDGTVLGCRAADKILRML